MDFLIIYFFKNEFLIKCLFLSSKLDSSIIKTLERHSLRAKKSFSNVLITGESNLDESRDERNGQLIKRFILKEIPSYKIHSLVRSTTARFLAQRKSYYII